MHRVDTGSTSRRDGRGDYGSSEDDCSGRNQSQCSRLLHLSEVFANHAFQEKPSQETRCYSYTRDHEAFQEDLDENAAGLRTQSQADSELARAPAHGEREHARHSNHGNQQRQSGEASEHDGVESMLFRGSCE